MNIQIEGCVEGLNTYEAMGEIPLNANIWDLEQIWSSLGDRTQSGRKV